MGTCMSTCQQKPSTKDYNPPSHDKLIIPQVSIVHPQSKFSTHPCVSSPSSSSSFTSNTPTSSATSFGTSITSSCSSSSTSGQRILSDECLLACMIKEKHNIIVLDPRKYDNTIAKPVQSLRRQPTVKRLRSRSPPAPVTRRKTLRSEQSPAAPRSCRKQSIPSPVRTMINKDVRKPKLHCSSSLEASINRVSQLEKSNRKQKPAQGQVYNYQMGQGGLSKPNSRICPLEDIDNPLISMDCFIFI